jgi:hypothetical protein
MRDLFHVGDCAICGDAVQSDDGSPYGILIERHKDGVVEVSHLSCVARELGVSEQRADEYRPLCYMSDGRAANYIDGLMESAFERQQSGSGAGFLSPDALQRSLKR